MKATIKFILRNYYTNKDGKQQLCLRYTARRKAIFIGLNITLAPQHWNEKSSVVRAGEPKHHFYNKFIRDIYRKADHIIMENYLTPLPSKEFRNLLFGKEEKEVKCFYTFINEEIELLKPTKAKGTISNYYKVINTMKEWKSELSFDEIDLDYIQRFHNHELELGNILSTIYKKHANFKYLIGLAIKKKKIAKNPYTHFADLADLGGGFFSALSTQAIGNSDFYNGAFPAEYNNALSGVFDIHMRNGNNRKYEHTFQLGLLGVDLASEGPISKKQGSSYLFNYRISTTSFATGGETNLNYQDLAFKLNFPTPKAGTFSFWALGLMDKDSLPFPGFIQTIMYWLINRPQQTN